MSISSKIRLLTLVAFAVGIMNIHAQSLPVLATGKWYKFSVTKDGMYKIDYNLLRSAGINPDRIDPKKIRMFSGQLGMLSQSNSAPRTSHLQELAIEVQGESDGSFNRNDIILFYGNGPDRVNYVPSREIFAYENNLYSDKNFYFLTVSETDGKRVTLSPNESGNFPIVNSYHDFQVYENDKNNILNSGREWFGEIFDTSTEIRIGYDFSKIVNNSSIKVVSQVMAQANQPTSFKVFFNNVEIGEQRIQAIPNTQYGEKGRKAIDTLVVSSGAVGTSGRVQQEIKYQYIKSSTVRSVGYLDFASITCERALEWNGEPFIFLNGRSTQQPFSTFVIGALPGSASVWDITDVYNVKKQDVNRTADQASFSCATATLKNFVAFDVVEAAPTFEQEVPNQNLRESSPVSLLIVTHPDFLAQAKRLAAHRESYSKQTVLVVTVDEVYNEFSGGKQDATAIRDFARWMYLLGPSTSLRNLLLFGKCSFDFKNRVTSNTNFVPTYQSRNSLSPLETYSSDDYFAFFDLAEGDWREAPAQSHTMDIGVGRLPVTTAQQAKDVVDKLIAYDLQPKARGNWRQKLLFVADDGDFNIHQSQGNQLADEVISLQPELEVEKLFLSSFPQQRRPSGQISPQAVDALNRAIQTGALIVNYTGHGSERILAEERLIEPESANEWNNRHRLPLWVTATCEFGSHDNPLLISTGESLLTKKNGGAVGLVTTSRPVNSSTNFILNKAFYEAFFVKEGSSFLTLGEVFKRTKNSSLSGVANRNFSLLGDPSMKLALAENKVVLTSLTTRGGPDTLKSLSRVILKGEIRQDNQKLATFNGTLSATLFDKISNVSTAGDSDELSNPPSPPFTYTDRSSVLFKGVATVQDGAFEMEFVMPGGLPQQLSNGKLLLHAIDNNGMQAAGAHQPVKTGFTDNNSTTDNSGPQIELFLGDTTYEAGGIVSSNTDFIARLHDNQGINTSGYGNGNLLITLDDSITYKGNNFFTAARDDFSSGLLVFPVFNLSNGSHTLQLQCADMNGNTSTQEITFSVGQENVMTINSLLNYPNPFSNSTTFQFSHNRPGDDLEAYLSVYNSSGQLVYSAQNLVDESLYTVTLGEWNIREQAPNLLPGIYFARLVVRSQSDGAKNEKLTKLIILN